MQIITINLPEKYLNAIKILIDLGRVESRSEAIRIAVKDLLKTDLSFDCDLGFFQEHFLEDTT